MNADRLLAHYERIADTPDDIPRLRRFILDLAVRSKLVDQNPNDEPASELLKRIATEKARLMKAGELRKWKNSPDLSRVELPFPLPPKWNWSRISEIGVIGPRNNVPDDLTASFVSMSMISDHYGIEHDHQPRPWATIKKGYTHFAEGDVGLAKITPCFENGKSTVFRNLIGGVGSGTTELHIIRPLFVNPGYIIVFLKSPHFIQNGIDKMTGTAGQKRVPVEYFANAPFPLPPLAEQHRIVTRVNELMMLCDQLEETRTKQETTRNRLTTASLARLNTPDPNLVTFQKHTMFSLENLAALTTRPDQIQTLRQTILNLAVRGKLVPQNSTGESASRLLEGIVKSKERPCRRIENISQSYGLPETWTWAALDELIITGPQNGISPKPTTRTDAPKAVTLTATTSGTFKPNNFKHVEANITDDSELWLRDGDLLFQRGNTREYVGMAAIYEGPSRTFLFPDLMMRVRVSPLVNLRFVHLAAISPPARAYFSENASGAQATMPKINQTILISLPIPLPPLTEQHQIVAKVDELRTLCDQLEQSLTTAGDTRRRLLDAIFYDTLDALS